MANPWPIDFYIYILCIYIVENTSVIAKSLKRSEISSHTIPQEQREQVAKQQESFMLNMLVFGKTIRWRNRMKWKASH